MEQSRQTFLPSLTVVWPLGSCSEDPSFCHSNGLSTFCGPKGWLKWVNALHLPAGLPDPDWYHQTTVGLAEAWKAGILLSKALQYMGRGSLLRAWMPVGYPGHNNPSLLRPVPKGADCVPPL